MSAIFAHAIRYGGATRNTGTAVRISTPRLKDPEFLRPAEMRALLIRLPHHERVVVLFDATTGLRRGERMALRWQDLDFENNIADITRSICRNIAGNTETRASRKPVPLHPILFQESRQGWSEPQYQADSDFLFLSIQKNSSRPLQPDMILKRHIRPALEQLAVKKRNAWHSFRHGLSQFLRQHGIDLKIAQELLRHANSRITLDIYQQTVTKERRAAPDAGVQRTLAR